MTKHGLSHAAGTLVCVVTSGLLVKQLDKHNPAITAFIDRASLALIHTFSLAWSRHTVTRFLLATLLAFAWGVAFKWTVDRAGT
jgi:MFS-type transporter involved in bile tolerance (Atg22 family)